MFHDPRPLSWKRGHDVQQDSSGCHSSLEDTQSLLPTKALLSHATAALLPPLREPWGGGGVLCSSAALSIVSGVGLFFEVIIDMI